MQSTYWKFLPLITAMALVGCGDDKPLTDDAQPGDDGGDKPGNGDGAGDGDSGGDDGDKPTPDPEPTLTTINGVVADGYLRDALVCADLNQNWNCDDEEPAAYSGADGAWSLEVDQEALENEGRIVAKAIANLTIDQDHGNPVSESYTLVADFSMGKSGKPIFVSPITTLVAYEADHGQLDTVADAEAAVQARLATMASLTSDYIERKSRSKASQDEKQEYEYLHRIAQVSALMKGHYEKQLREAGYNSTKSAETATTKIRSIMDVITADARASLSQDGPFNPDSIIAAGNYKDLIPPPSPSTGDGEDNSEIVLEDLGTLVTGESPFYTASGAPVTKLSLTETRAQYNNESKTVELSAFRSTLMESPAPGDDGGEEAGGSDTGDTTVWYQKVPQKIEYDSGRGIATLKGNLESTPHAYIAWSPSANGFVESSGYRGTMGLRSITQNSDSAKGGVFGGAVTTTVEYTKVVTGYLGFQELFDWQFGHSAPERYFLKTRPGITAWETPMFSNVETLDNALLVARKTLDNGEDNAVQLSTNEGPAGSIGAVVGDTQNLIKGLVNKDGKAVSMRLSGTADNGKIQLLLSDGTVTGDTGTYAMETAPIPHLRLAIPSSYQLPAAQNGFELGYPILAEMQGRVRLAWALPKDTNTSYLFGGNGTNMEYSISYSVIRELSQVVPVTIAE